ncbi:aliphatic nitrilase [Fusarium subglutinans]|uniref:nitrilase n=1 Tax=Gibberella subglutinans TaxID=42677 RepID=A0A8H5KU24_GIBSU|nr:aliphatic nitrilase [Fusarium subglutinans]KAF5579912.1 aliphatic nitrilase [Fusarium subglutinans]
MDQTVKVGAVQAEPVWLDLEGSVDKTISLIEKAAADGVQVLGFPEVWIPGYPWQMWTSLVINNGGWIHEYMANSMRRDSPQMKRIQQAIKKAERTIWGEGQAESLKVVVDSKFGKVGALNCWEHLQLLLRYNEYAQGVQIHIASWLAEFEMLDPEKIAWLYHETGEASYRASQFMAIEGATFVAVASQVLTEKNLERNGLTGNPVTKTPGGGFSMIFGPDGKPLAEPIGDGEEGIITVVVNLRDIDKPKAFIDVVGHYARPDLLSLKVNEKVAKHVIVD